MTVIIGDLFKEHQSKLQFGFTAGTAILVASFLLGEASASSHHTFATFLEAEKAFDVVWQDGLLRKLALLNVPIDIWYCLNEWYCNITASVAWSDRISEEFRICQGV